MHRAHTLNIAPQPITAAQKNAMHELASAAHAQISFTSPHGVTPSIKLVSRNLNARYPHSQDGYQAMQNLLAQLTLTPGKK